MPLTGFPARALGRSPRVDERAGGAVAVRNHVARWTLTAGACAGLLAWQSFGPWAGMVPVLAALLVASVAYRIESPRIDLDGPLPPLEAEAAGDVARSATPTFDQ